MVDKLWVNRLVRAGVDLEANQIRCDRLRRRAPEEQPLTIPLTPSSGMSLEARQAQTAGWGP